MADKKMYAWSPILNQKKNVKVGEEVSESDLDISEDEWDYLVQSGSVRPQKYPSHDDGSPVSISPTQHLHEQAAKLADGGYTAEELEAVQPTTNEVPK